MPEPKQKPGSSKQDYATPPDFLAAVRKRFRVIDNFGIDLAAHEGNHVCEKWFGPGSTDPDSLAVKWSDWSSRGDFWLNPPFGAIEPWAEKCAETLDQSASARIFLLTPASIGSNWFAKHVWKKARVYAIQGRLSFNEKGPFPKDCILSIYSRDRDYDPGFEVWDWRSTISDGRRASSHAPPLHG